MSEHKINELPTEATPTQSMTTKVVRAGAWVSSRILVTSLINLVVMAILARQLNPATFGIVALAQVILRFLVVLASEGVNEFVIYDNKPGREERIQAAFWMDLTLSTVAAGVGLLLVPLVTQFYTEPELGPVLVMILLRYPFDSLSKIPDALLKKGLNFQRLVIRDTILEVLTSLSSILMALTGFGVWSIVVPTTIASLLRAIIVFHMVSWRPGLAFHFHQWRRIFSYSANVIGGTLVGMFTADGDTLLVGKLLGSHALGVYNLAWMVSNLVSNNINGVVNRLALPAFSAVSSDLPRLRSGLTRTLRVVSLCTFPLLIGLFVVADDVIMTLYGPQWQNAIVPLRIFIIYALRYSVGSPVGIIFKAMGRTDISFKLGLVIIPFYLAGILIGSAWGIIGVSIGVTIVRTAFGLLTFELVARCLKTDFMSIVEPLFPAFFASCSMGVIVFLAKSVLNGLLPENYLLRLLCLVALGGITYWLLLRIVYHTLARELAAVTAPLLGPFQKFVVKALGIHHA